MRYVMCAVVCLWKPLCVAAVGCFQLLGAVSDAQTKLFLYSHGLQRIAMNLFQLFVICFFKAPKSSVASCMWSVTITLSLSIYSDLAFSKFYYLLWCKVAVLYVWFLNSECHVTGGQLSVDWSWSMWEVGWWTRLWWHWNSTKVQCSRCQLCKTRSVIQV